MSLTRDTEYYREDGDLVVKVEDTLFRIDKGALKREPSMFTDMFKMPHPDGHVDGESDDHPLILRDDTAEEFRALCWAIYISLGEVPSLFNRRSTTTQFSTAEISKFLSLALISHKYGFSRLEPWAYSFIQHFCQESNDGEMVPVIFSQRFTMLCSSDELDRLIRYATISSRTTLLNELSNVLLSRLDSDPPTLQLVDALCIGEQHGWQDFQAEVYYRIVCHWSRAVSESGSEKFSTILTRTFPTHLLPPGLTDDQQTRATRGYTCLTFMTAQIMHTVFTTLHNRAFSLENYGLHRPPVDIIGRLEDISRSIAFSYGYSGQDGQEVLENLLTLVKAILPNCFFGEETVEVPDQKYAATQGDLSVTTSM